MSPFFLTERFLGFFFNVFIYRLYLFYMIMGQSKGSFFDDMLRGVYVFCMYNSFPICKL